ncbi:uncharacterized protein [Diabrotica undecimpunctata]|uniref:uncharacterized protein n=1 Tax=Diabrotica undecimpunctata TaxID=50387 RepID=UPI003B63DED1
MAVVWTNELTETLIHLYHSQTVLWDSTDENYKNKNKKKDSWKSISNFMGLHELELRRKIKNLTSQFFREKKKLKDDTKSGACDTPRWFAYQWLLFLTDKNEPRSFVEKELNEAYDSDSEKNIEIDSFILNPSIKEEHIDDIATQALPEPQPLDQQPGPSTTSQIIENRQASKRRATISDQRQEETYNLLNELKAKNPRNRFTIFGEYVATKVEALNSSYAQNMVEHLISNILFEASIGKYDYPATKENNPTLNTYL